MECFVVKVPEGKRLTGFTIAGQRVPILPGEYHVHRMVPRTRPGLGALRFVGAHGGGCDVHVCLPEGTDIEEALSVKARLASAG